MIKKMIVTTDGVNLIGRVKQSAPAHWKTRGGRSEKSRKFDKYYYEAQYAGIPEKEIPDYIQMRFIEDADDIINDALDDVEFEELWKNFQNRFHKRLKRYKEKICMNEWNYFVTFTYDNKKETAEGFEKRLIITFNNLAKRNGWKVIGGWENGELEGRSHFHAFIHVPEGQMVGELIPSKRYSYKRHKMEYYTDNSYFQDRFGMSDWIAVTKENLISGNLVSYLVKYVIKSGRKLFYSRGIANELELEVDTDDVFMSFYHHGFKHVLNAKKVLSDVKAAYISLFEYEGFEYHDFEDSDSCFCGFTEDIMKCPVV